jgi:diacylglycerol kinase (ATP)
VKSRSLFWSFNYAIQGIVYSIRTQRNMRLHTFVAAVVLTSALLLDVDRMEMVVIVFAIGFVLVTELANTALEAAVDVATHRFDPTAKVAKDVAAGAVLIASLNAVAVGYLVLFDRLTELATDGFTIVRQSSAHLTVIALALTALAVMVVKAINQEGTFLRGGWPSGHVGLAVAAATAIGYATESGPAAVLGYFIAGLVAHSRIESEVHTIAQAVFGGVLGFLITTTVFQVFFT